MGRGGDKARDRKKGGGVYIQKGGEREKETEERKERERRGGIQKGGEREKETEERKERGGGGGGTEKKRQREREALHEGITGYASIRDRIVGFPEKL